MKATIQQIVNEFVDAGVVYDEVSLQVSLENNPFVGDNYSDCLAHVTTVMIKDGLYVCTESTPTRQAIRDLFVEHYKEHQMLSSGNDKLSGFFVGRAMKILGRSYDPKKVGLRLAEMSAEDKMKWWFEC